MSESKSSSSSSSSSRAAADAKVQVVVRLRPLNKSESAGNEVPVVTASTERKEITVVRGGGTRSALRQQFRFDNVFGSYATQQEIFDQTLKPIVADVLKGYESTVFAYGQTGTGKTFTMEGNVANKAEAGVIPRSVEAIFAALEDDRYVKHKVTVSYLEIYNEELCDLLVEDDAKQKLLICAAGKQKRVQCKGLSEHEGGSRVAVRVAFCGGRGRVWGWALLLLLLLLLVDVVVVVVMVVVRRW